MLGERKVILTLFCVIYHNVSCYTVNVTTDQKGKVMPAIDFLKRQAAYAATRLQRNRTATNTYSGTGSYERIINGWALGTMRSWSEDTEYFSNVHTDYEQQQH